MTLVTRSSFNGKGELQSKENYMQLKKYVWIDEAGKIAETTDNSIPNTWRKGKLQSCLKFVGLCLVFCFENPQIRPKGQ